jgi:transmembrane sensor
MNEDLNISLVKYITGQADETESAEVREWIKLNPENETHYFELYEAWHNSLYADKDLIDVDGAYDKFLKKTSGKQTFRRLAYWSKFSAAALIVCVGLFGVYRYVANNQKAEVYVELNVPKGTTRKMILPDGSTVWLNSGTKITYSKEFGRTNRTIFLIGEAYFDIKKSDTDVPFLVKTDNFTIRDVGTIFNVKAYPEEQVFETTVVEGKVSVEGNLTAGSEQESKVFLDANQVLKIKTVSESNASVTRKEKIEEEPVRVIQLVESQVVEYNGWKDDFLIFKGHTFEDIARILERRYDVSIAFQDEELKHFRYTGTFKNIAHISKVLTVIKENTPIDYNTEGKLITIVKTK